ncbi:MAG: hypothetical protein H7144_14565 [Burkholderiales bacterium]|nr:hypothetical protein [Phycisphaerae bacterium]
MLKLLLCIFSAVVISGALLHLKHQKMELSYKTNQAHRRLQNLQIELWNQQLQVAIYTAPNAIERTVGSHKLGLVPTHRPAGASPAEHASDAE